jgi:ATP/maltotriose-dependent transcriptional regulator MalT/DNA-binding SARP family transcriptional activator
MSSSVQAVPPALAAGIVARPRLLRRLDVAAARRLTVLVAGAGAGKSTLLASWDATVGAAWYTVSEADRDLLQLARGLLGALTLRVPALHGAVAGRLERTVGPEAAGDERSRSRACAALIADALATYLTRDLVLVVDDVHELRADDPGMGLIEALCRQAPPRLHIVVSTRDPLPFSVERLRGQGLATTLSGTALAFDAEEIAAILEAGLGSRDPELVEEVARVTGGWPAAVRLALEALVDVPAGERVARARRFLQPAGAIYAYLAEEVLGRASPEVRELLGAVAPLPRFGARLCAALGIQHAEATIRSLEERGLFVQALGDGQWFRLHPLIREYLVMRASAGDGRAAALTTAARWFSDEGAHRDSLECLLALGDPRPVAGALDEHGDELLSGGEVDAVISAASSLPANLRSATIERLEGEARQIRGDWEGALRCFRSLAPPDAPIDPGIAWRMGLIHHLRGELDDALRTYQRGAATDGSEPRDVALLAAWTAAAHWLRSDPDACRAKAAEALEAAVASGDDQALAAAHTIAAMVAALDGDRRANDAHYLRALEHAARCGDVLQTIRIRANRGSRLVEEGYYEEALDELTAATALAEVAGFAAFHALALSNRGNALHRLGRLEEAIADLEASRKLYQRLESRMVSYPLGHLGDVHADRGAFAVARAHDEEAIAVADVWRDVQGLRPALAGLAELLARDDPERAADLAERAVGFGPGIGLVRALLARGSVALARGMHAEARLAAQAAAAEAGVRRDRAGLAEALELDAASASDPSAAVATLEEALLAWRDLRCPLEAARVELRLSEIDGRVPAGDPDGVLHAAGAARSRMPPGPTAGPTSGEAPESIDAPVRVRTFGGFEVVRWGRAVTNAEWGSRKARDLFKILIARQGQHVPREQLAEILWPAEDPDRSSRRLSVAISTVRSALDPHKANPAAHFVASDRDTVWIDRAHVALDVDAFLADAAEGLDLAAKGQPEATAHLRAAEAAHRGEFLVEDAFEDWAAALREECRQTYISVGHALAGSSGAVGDHAAAARYLRRVLQYDEFDEKAHLSLVAALAAAGHPADARRAYGTYLARMEELGVEADAFPA